MKIKEDLRYNYSKRTVEMFFIKSILETPNSSGFELVGPKFG